MILFFEDYLNEAEFDRKERSREAARALNLGKHFGKGEKVYNAYMSAEEKKKKYVDSSKHYLEGHVGKLFGQKKLHIEKRLKEIAAWETYYHSKEAKERNPKDKKKYQLKIKKLDIEKTNLNKKLHGK